MRDGSQHKDWGPARSYSGPGDLRPGMAWERLPAPGTLESLRAGAWPRSGDCSPDTQPLRVPVASPAVLKEPLRHILGPPPSQSHDWIRVSCTCVPPPSWGGEDEGLPLHALAIVIAMSLPICPYRSHPDHPGHWQDLTWGQILSVHPDGQAAHIDPGSWQEVSTPERRQLEPGAREHQALLCSPGYTGNLQGGKLGHPAALASPHLEACVDHLMGASHAVATLSDAGTSKAGAVLSAGAENVLIRYSAGACGSHWDSATGEHALWSHPAGLDPKVHVPCRAQQHLPMAQVLGFLSAQPAGPLNHVLGNGSGGGGSHKACSETQLILERPGATRSFRRTHPLPERKLRPGLACSPKGKN